MTQQQPALILRLVAAAWLLLQPCIADATLPCTYVSTSAEITTVLGAAIGSHRLCIEEQHTILAQPYAYSLFLHDQTAAHHDTLRFRTRLLHAWSCVADKLVVYECQHAPAFANYQNKALSDVLCVQQARSNECEQLCGELNTSSACACFRERFAAW